MNCSPGRASSVLHVAAPATHRARTKRAALAVILFAALSLVAGLVPATAASANPDSRGAVKILGKNDPGSLPVARLLADYWALVYGTPDGGLPECGRFGRARILKVPSGNGCTTREGKPVFLFAFGDAVSNLEEPFSSDAAVQRAAARAFDLSAVQSLVVSIDGGAPVDIRARGFEVGSPQRTVQLPENNVLGVDPQPITFTAHGWTATIRGLRPGLRHIGVTFTFVNVDDGSTAVFVGDFVVRVLPSR